MFKRLRKPARAALAIAILGLATASTAQANTFSYHSVGSFGETGSAEGQLAKSPIPQRLATDPYGNVYVVDRGNSRIEIFEGTEEGGSFLTKIATSAPLGVAVDPSSGAVYVSHAGTDEKQQITPPVSGKYTLCFEAQCTGELEHTATEKQITEALQALTKIGPGNVLVNAAKEAIFEGGLGGQDVAQITCSPSCSVSTLTPGAFGSVSKYLPLEGEFPPGFGTKYAEAPAEEFTPPKEVAIAGLRTANSNATGAIAVDPTGANDFLVISGKGVKRFAPTGGTALSSFNGQSSGTAFNDPADLAVDPKGNVLVADITSSAAARVIRFSPNGETAKALSPEAPNPVVSPIGATANAAGIAIGVDPQSGEAFVSSKSPSATSAGQIYRYGEANSLIEGFGIPSEVGTGLNGPITGIATTGAPASLYVMSTNATGEPAVQVFRPTENFPLTIEQKGNGTGTVQCEVSGSGKPEPCKAEYPEGTELTLIATPTEGNGSVFAGYSGDCEGESCELFFSEAHTLTATFKIPQHFPLTVKTEGTGAGKVSCEVFGTGTPEPCLAEYPEETELVLYPEAEALSEFAGFTGDCTGTSCELLMSKAHEVTATFNLEAGAASLSIAKAGTGTGTLKCEANGGPAEACAAAYAKGTALKVSATAEAGSEFKGFSKGTGSAASCSASPCSFKLEANSALTATFSLIQRALTIDKAGSGSGSFECKTTGSFGACAPSYPNGETITVKATEDPHSSFAGWSGCSSTSGHECTVSAIGADTTVTATFDLIQRALTIVKAGTGTGSVTCAANGGPAEACAPSYANGTNLEVEASANAGSQFTGFSAASGSAASCSASPCSFTIEADSALTASFKAIPPEETCATNPALCPPPTEGKAKAASTALVKSGKALLKLSCTGGPCKGALKLTAKLKVGTKTKSMVIGKGSFSLAAGATQTLSVKLSAAAVKALKKAKALKASLTGSGIAAGKVKLK